MTRKAATTYLRFDDRTLQGEKTTTLRVTNMQGSALGIISWYSPWRRYVFHPGPGTLFDTGCLYEVMRKIGELMQARTAAREAKKTGERPVL